MKAALLIYTSDREDGWLLGFVAAFPLYYEPKTYEDAIELVQSKLSSEEVLKQVIDKDVGGDSSKYSDYKCIFCGYRNYGLEYDFEYKGEEQGFVVHKSLDFIKIFD